MISVPPICLAMPDDARAIAEMSRDCIEYGLGWSWTPGRVLMALGDRATNVAIIRERGRLLGFGIMHYGLERAHLSLLGVDPGHRRRGHASSLLAWLEKCADTAGTPRILVEARADNPGALAFYRRHGYRPLQRIPGYYRGLVDAERLEKRLWGEPEGDAPA